MLSHARTQAARHEVRTMPRIRLVPLAFAKWRACARPPTIVRVKNTHGLLDTAAEAWSAQLAELKGLAGRYSSVIMGSVVVSAATVVCFWDPIKSFVVGETTDVAARSLARDEVQSSAGELALAAVDRVLGDPVSHERASVFVQKVLLTDVVQAALCDRVQGVTNDATTIARVQEVLVDVFSSARTQEALVHALHLLCQHPDAQADLAALAERVLATPSLHRALWRAVRGSLGL